MGWFFDFRVFGCGGVIVFAVVVGRFGFES